MEILSPTDFPQSWGKAEMEAYARDEYGPSSFEDMCHFTQEKGEDFEEAKNVDFLAFCQQELMSGKLY